MTVSGALLAVVHLGLLSWTWPRRGVLHPATLWLLVFSFTTTLYALHLLPYRAMHLETAVLLVAATLCVVVGIELGERAATRGHRPRLSAAGPADQPTETPDDLEPAARRSWRAVLWGSTIERGATIALLGMFAWTALFVVQVAASAGIRNTLISSLEVRLAIQDGLAGIGVKFVYATLAAAALTGIAAARATTPRERNLWLLGVASTAVAAYLSTGRSNIILPLLIAGVAFGVARGGRVSLRTQAIVGGGSLVFVLTIFTIGGSIIGKTFENNPLRLVPGVLTNHATLQPFALPYQYATGPIAALDVQVQVAKRTPSTDGCAVFAVACQIGGAAGLDMVALPNIRPFTAAPMPWNTYTALDRPLLDAGPGGVVALFAAIGLVLGWLWQLALRGAAAAVAVYAVAACAVLYAPIQNNFLAPHIIGAVVLAGASLAAAALWPRASSVLHRREPAATASSTTDG